MFPKYLTYLQTYFLLLKTKDDILNNISLFPMIYHLVQLNDWLQVSYTKLQYGLSAQVVKF